MITLLSGLSFAQVGVALSAFDSLTAKCPQKTLMAHVITADDGINGLVGYCRALDIETQQTAEEAVAVCNGQRFVLRLHGERVTLTREDEVVWTTSAAAGELPDLAAEEVPCDLFDGASSLKPTNQFRRPLDQEPVSVRLALPDEERDPLAWTSSLPEPVEPQPEPRVDDLGKAEGRARKACPRDTGGVVLELHLVDGSVAAARVRVHTTDDAHASCVAEAVAGARVVRGPRSGTALWALRFGD